MNIFFIVLAGLLITNYLLLQFSCNDSADSEVSKDK